MKELKNSVVAITGAASGIGRSLAINLAKEGCGLALADIDQNGLNQTADMIKDNDVKITTYVLDVADREQVYRFADNVVGEHGKVNIIYDFMQRMFPVGWQKLMARV